MTKGVSKVVELFKKSKLALSVGASGQLSFKDIFKQVTKTMENIKAKAVELQDSVFTKFKSFSDKASSLIARLEIGSLNSIFELANVLKSEFESIIKSFPDTLKEILTFESLVGRDLKNLFQFESIFKSIQYRIERKYNESVARILNKLNHTEKELALNSLLYKKLQNSSVFQQLQKVNTTLVVKFQTLWSEGTVYVNEINALVRQVTV